MSSYRNIAAGPHKHVHLGGAGGAAGFTLIEIMIVVLIIGVLSAIAYASYDRSVINTRRATAAGCVQEGAHYMERYHTTHMSYHDATEEPVLPPCSAEVTQYDIELTDSDAGGYTITATPTGRQLSKDTVCAALSINQLGERSVSGSSSADPGSCW